MSTVPRLIVGMLALILATHVRAQPAFHLERPEIIATYRFEFEDENEKTPRGSRSERTTRHIGNLLIETGGWAYDPGLLEFDLAFEPEYRVENIQLPGDGDQENDGYFLNYLLNATFLQFKPYSLNLFNTQSRRQYTYAFTEDTVVKNFVLRPSVRLEFRPVITRLTYEKRNTEITGVQDSEQDIDLLRWNLNHQVERSETTFIAEHAKDDRRADGRADRVNRDRISLLNQFDVRKNALLTTNIGYHRDDPEVGLASESESFRWSERLNWRHRDNLSSHYWVRHDRQGIENQRTKQWIYEAGVQHQLYDNLLSSAAVRGNNLRSNDGDINLYDGNFDFNYTRAIPWGTINAFTGYFVRYEDNARQADEVFDEPVRLVGTQEVELAQLNIELGSVVVTDAATQLVLYELGRDYVLTEVEGDAGTTILIRRSGPTSSIRDGETVLVDYRFEPVPPFELVRNQFNLGFGVNLWSAFRVTYALTRIAENLVAGTAPPDLADDWIQRADAELRWRWSTTRLGWEDRDTVRSPTTTFFAQERLLFWLGRRWSLGAYAAYTDRTYQDLDDEQNTIAFGGNTRWQITPRLGLDIEAYDERIRGDRQDTDRVGMRSALNWRYGLWLARLEYRYDRYEDHLVSRIRDDHRVWAEIAREFW